MWLFVQITGYFGTILTWNGVHQFSFSNPSLLPPVYHRPPLHTHVHNGDLKFKISYRNFRGQLSLSLNPPQITPQLLHQI